ncbi:hypothetical protein GCM10017688_01380 [Streptomyces ramulosus]
MRGPGSREPAARQEELQAEADEVAADLGLARLLPACGEPVRVGSAALGLMVVPDLDITVICPELDDATRRAVAAIGAELAVRDRVREVTFRDDTGHWNTDPRYPDGLYLKIRHRSRTGREWTVDLWFVDEPDRQPDLAHVRTLPLRLTDDHRAAILRIKQVLAGRTGARVPSHQVYRAVLDGAVTTADGFDAWYARERGGRDGEG